MHDNEIEVLKRMVKGYEESLPKLKILIFGPGERNPNEYAQKCFRKRREIKEILTNKNHFAILPEEAFDEARRQGKEYSNITSFEKYLIEQQCDLAVFLYVPKCPGVAHELDVFSIIPECVRKIYLFYGKDCQYNSEWTLKDKEEFVIGGSGHVDSFCQNDIEKCELGKKIIKIVENVRRFLSMHPYKKYEEVK
ncbi:hypothetical protein KJA13_03090 [Patescibacteria group bacterium]|nr:hypothetical protein [Patescibacteria group bacterium]